MSVKLIALGNELMRDDAIALTVANILKGELEKMGVEVILGGTDIGHCITSIEQDDFLIIMDAACLHKQVGEITLLSLNDKIAGSYKNQHDISLLELLPVYFQKPKGILLGIEIDEVCFRYGLSPCLLNKVANISNDILEIVREVILQREFPILRGEAGV